MIHYLEVAALLIVVAFQIAFFQRAKKKFNTLKNIFENSRPKAALRRNGRWHDAETGDPVLLNDHGVEFSEGVQIIHTKSEDCSPYFEEIYSQINDFFLANEGAEANFNLMQDIVERQCEKLEGEAEDMIPLPLYCGLAGTILGIIFGLGGIWASDGGFAGFVENPGASIGYLLGGIALAMIVSLLGLVMTTNLTTRHTATRSKLLEDKNQFYNWLQSTFMPNMAADLPSAINQLRENLGGFNQRLEKNVSRMERVFGTAAASMKQQKEILDAIHNIDVAKMARYNMAVLEKFQESINHTEQFNNVFETLKTAAVNLENHQEIIQRNARASASIRDNFDKFSEEINDRIEAASNKFNEVLVKQQESVIKSLEANDQRMTAAFEQGHRKLVAAFTDYQAMTKEFKELPNIKTSLDAMAKQMAQQTKALQQMIASAQQRTATSSKTSKGEANKMVVTHGQVSSTAPWQRYVTWALMFVVALAVTFVGVTNVMMMGKMDEHAQTLVADSTNVSLEDTLTERKIQERAVGTKTSDAQVQGDKRVSTAAPSQPQKQIDDSGSEKTKTISEKSASKERKSIK